MPAKSIRSPVITALPTGTELLRETCGGSSLLHERSSLPTGDELRALVFGTCALDPLLSGRPASTVATAQLCHTRRPHRSMLPVRQAQPELPTSTAPAMACCF